MIERKALIFNIQKYNMYDGPGIRTLVFFKGCPLRCKWCSNPESQLRQYQVLFKHDACVNCGECAKVCPVGIHKMSFRGEHEMVQGIECIGCNKCVGVCNYKALAMMGEEKRISELLDIIEEDRPFYETSGGGVTLGGGECLMQPEAVTNLLMACKQRGLNTAIETCGYAQASTILKVAEFTDLFLYDVKHMNSERHHELTGVRNELILNNLKLLLDERYNVKVRLPLMRGLNDADECLVQLAEFLLPYRDAKNFKGIDILPYHKLGVNKYKQLFMEYGVDNSAVLDEADLVRIENCFKRFDFNVTVVKH